MKKALALILALMMVCTLFSGTVAFADDASYWETAEPIEILFAHGYAGSELAVELVDEWMANVTEKSQGKITWDYHPGGSMGSITELIEQTDLGAIDCTLSDTSQLQNFCDEYALLFYPFLIQSYDHQVKVLNSDIMDKFNEILVNGSNLYALGYYVNGVRNIDTVKKITNLEDCKGVILRVPEIQVYKDVATLLGMSPVAISYSEVYTAMSTGVCEGFECPNNSIYPGGYHKVAPYILKSGHMFSSCALEFNKDVWAGYPEEVQNLLKDEFMALTEAHAKKIIDADEEYYRLYVEEGATVSEWDDPAEVAAACESYWLENAEALGPEALEIANEIIAMRS